MYALDHVLFRKQIEIAAYRNLGNTERSAQLLHAGEALALMIDTICSRRTAAGLSATALAFPQPTQARKVRIAGRTRGTCAL